MTMDFPSEARFTLIALEAARHVARTPAVTFDEILEQAGNYLDLTTSLRNRLWSGLVWLILHHQVERLSTGRYRLVVEVCLRTLTGCAG